MGMLGAMQHVYRRAKKLVRRYVKVRPPRVKVDIDKLLVGGDCGISSRQYSLLTNRPMRSSTRFVYGPHVLLLQAYQAHGERILEWDMFRETAYFKNAMQAIDLCGSYFETRRPEEVVVVARRFLDRFEGRTDKSTVKPYKHQSRNGEHVRIQAVADSSYYSVVDGNHRAAIEFMRGAKQIVAEVVRNPERTPMQQMLFDVLWINGEKKLYQPMDLPECEDNWAIIRTCTDRLEMVRKCLRDNGIPASGTSFLDIGSYYGWFVAQMAKDGMDSYGIERDRIASKIGEYVYGVRPEQILIGDCVRVLEGADRKWDVVSFQSVLHHFALGKGSISAEELVRLVDSVTGKIMIFETGEAHEEWFANTLPDWTRDFVEDWLRRTTTFSKIVPLGRDSDRVGAFKDNYGRTLFACIR